MGWGVALGGRRKNRLGRVNKDVRRTLYPPSGPVIGEGWEKKK